MIHTKENNWLWIALTAIILALFFWHYLIPIWDIDFWWHAASGRWIIEHGQLPITDPFGVFDSNDSIRNQTVLTGQWLGQVTLYLVLDKLGVYGIIIFTALLSTLSLGILAWRLRLASNNHFITVTLLAITGFILFSYTGERPQLFSFLFASIAFLLIDKYHHQHKKWLWLIPIIGVIWANTHGAVILLEVLLGLYLLPNFINYRQLTKQQQYDTRYLTIITAALAVSTLITPNGLTTYYYIFDLQGSQLQASTSEYISSFKLYTLGYYLPQFWVGLFYLLVISTLPTLIKMDKGKALIILFLAIISAMSFRYFVFFALITTPYIALGLTHQTRQINILKKPLLTALPLLITTTLLLLLYSQNSLKQPINPIRYPVVITDFIKQNHMQGRVFNFFNWGGYLIWHLHPEIQPFIDGRMLNDEKLTAYTHILWATPDGTRWFEASNFDYVVIPYRSPMTGEVYKLNDYLQNSGRWRVIQKGLHGYLYARR